MLSSKRNVTPRLHHNIDAKLFKPDDSSKFASLETSAHTITVKGLGFLLGPT